MPVFLTPGNHENEEGWNLDDFDPDRASSLPVLSVNARKRYFLNPVPDAFYTGNLDPLPQADGDHLREDYYAFQWGDALFVVINPFAYTMMKPYAGGIGGENQGGLGNAAANTGNGGQGATGGAPPPQRASGAGGSGIVVIAYRIA